MRRHRIHNIFQRDNFTNCTKLAQELEVGVRTVLRDIEAMRNQDYPIGYDARRRVLYYTEAVYNLPSIHVTCSDLLALRVASAAFEQNEGTPFHRRLTRIYRILLNGVAQQDLAFSPERIGAAFSFYHVGVGPTVPDVFEALTNAVLRQKEVEFDYLKPADSETKHHRVQPCFITNRENLFYLIAQERKGREVKSFAIPRIVGPVRFTGREFVRSKRFSSVRHFRNAFRIFSGEVVHRITFRFSSRAAPYVRERHWHLSEKLTERADGSLLLQMELSDTRDLKSWILRWGADVEVLEPPDLREEIARATKAMAAIYG